jgi:2-hydroxy-6-oxonona-2,4-dienedioate hydrolase
MLDFKPLFDVGEGEPIILLSGLIGNLGNWGRVAYEFTSSHRILIPRLPFFQTPLAPSRLNDLVTYVEEFVEAHSLDKVIVIGNSLGGHIALHYAWRQPSKVRRLILASSSGIFENFEEYALPNEFDVHSNFSVRHNTIYHRRVAAKETNSTEFFQQVNGQSTLADRCQSELLSQHYSECFMLHHIYAPTLLIWGVDDAITPPEVALAFHEHLPQSKIIFLDQCGHLPMIDQPKLFNQHVRDFLER